MSLARSLTLFGAITLVVGNVVGAGIFTTAGLLASEVQSPAAFLLVWVLGGLLTASGALTYAELGAMFPRAGGDYQYLKEAYGSLAGFLLGWLNFAVIMPGSIAGLAVALVGHLPLPDALSNDIARKALAVLLVAALTGANVRGLRAASRIQNAVTVGTVALLALLIVGGALAGGGNADNFRFAAGVGPQPLRIPGSAMIAVFFTYAGWFAAAYVGSEVERPERNVPLALVVGTLVITALYTAVNAIYLFSVPLAEMRGASNVAELAAGVLFPAAVAPFVAVAIVLAIAGCTNATVMTGARVCYAMAVDGLLWSGLGRVHDRYRTPHVALAVQGLIAAVLIALGTFDSLVSYVVFAMVLASTATGVAQIVLRIRRPDLPRPYRTFGYPVVPIVFVGAYAWVAISIVVDRPETSCLGLAMVLSGVPFYFFWRSRSGREM